MKKAFGHRRLWFIKISEIQKLKISEIQKKTFEVLSF